MSVDGPPASGSLPYAQPVAPSLIGEVLDGRYKIVRKLGEGGMGEVFAAEHVHIEKRFAIKLLRPEIISNPEAVTRFRQEARSSSSIGHRNIIAIEDFGQLSDGRIYMCMELLNGAALNDLIMQPQTTERLLNILIQTGHGLAAAHAKNIVHRDMKPENIFVTVGPNNEDIPKLLDFGIAKVAGNDGQNNLTRTGTIFGTPFYMAPEQALGNPVDARTDIYAMGVIMYEVFSGSLPFQGESFMGILTQHITTEPEPVAQRAQKAGRTLPPGLAELITRCMNKNPAQRYSTMDELVNALIQIYRGIAGAGMSTYMEAFPVNSGQHPVPTPPPMTGMHNLGANASTPTVAAVAPPGAYSGPQQHYTPQPSHAAGQSGLYDPGSSYVAPKKSKTGLIVAIIAVLAVGGTVAAVMVIGDKETKAGDGSGSAIASNDPGSGTNVGTTTPDASVATTTVDAGAVAATVDAAAVEAADAATVATGTADAGSTDPAPVDAGSGGTTPVDPNPPAKVVQVPLVANVSSFEVWEGGAKVFEGPGNFEVPEGGKRSVVIKAKGYKDKKLVVDTKKKIVQFSLSPIKTTVTTPPPSKCSGTKADLRNPDCRSSYCAKHDEDPACGLE